MKKNLILTGHSILNRSLLLCTAFNLVACVGPQTKVASSELAVANECVLQYQTQSQQLNQQQREILASIQQLQDQLSAQQRIAETKPQLVEVTAGPKVDCPAAAPVTPPKPPAKEAPLTAKQIVGLREQVLLTGLNIVMPGQISTAIANSVLDARNIQMFERNGEEWVRFTVYNPTTKEPHVLERKRIRFQTLQNGNATSDRRPVVEMRFTVGRLTQKGEFVLADRSQAVTPILIGRNLLRDVMLVDVSSNNLTSLQSKDAASGSDAPRKSPR